MTITHGLSRKDGKNRVEYASWNAMHQRCGNPNDPKFRLYGGRGIRVCERWSGPDGCANFLADMGDRPPDKKSVDRIDTNGNYTPENCRWATAKEQYASQRVKGRTKLTSDQVRAIRADSRKPRRIIAEEYGVHCSTIKRIVLGGAWVGV